jgi:multiple sugar transport system permease protein
MVSVVVEADETAAGGPPGAGRRVRGRRRGLRDDRRVGWWFIAPVLVGFAVFYAYPTVRGIWYSVTDYSLLADPKYVGGDNYRKLISDGQFWNALKVTAYYVLVNIVSQTVLALGLATLMHRLTRSYVLRAALLVPWLVPNVTVGLTWAWLLDPDLGFVNHLLGTVGIDTTLSFNAPAWAMPLVALVNSWAYTGYTALLFYAGMLQIPGQLYESAAIDGAGEVRTFRMVTLPLLRPVLALVLVVSLIGSFQIFDTVAVVYGGKAPIPETRVIYYYIYQQAFTYFHMGYAAAVAMVLVLVLGVLTALQMHILRASRSDLG